MNPFLFTFRQFDKVLHRNRRVRLKEPRNNLTFARVERCIRSWCLCHKKLLCDWLALTRKVESAHRVCLATERENHVDHGPHFHWSAVQEEGSVAPGLHCVECGLLQFLWTTDNFQIFYRSVGSD